ncbi:NAD(P)-dependent oxidoreductase [bacterium]|nr:NAD(P)-dependent oxidoreductase [bacterium]
MIGMHLELQERERQKNPVAIGLVGAGQMGTDVVAQVRMMQGMEVVATADIDVARARNAYKIGQVEREIVEARSAEEADAAVRAGKFVVARDYRILTAMETVDVMLEATGFPEVGAMAALQAVRNGQQLAMMNVETDITVGPILNWYAKQNGVLYALAAGDEPAACKELFDFAASLGFTVVAAGKGKNNPLDRYARPDDPAWAKEAARRGLTPTMLIEFVDGSKTMIEMAAVANATGLAPDVRGMHGPSTHRDALNQAFALKTDGGCLNRVGVVDYGVGQVAPGVFLIVTTEHPRLREALVLRDMGNGPYYTLFRPFHLCSIEVPLTCAMLAIRQKSNMEPLNRLVAEVFAVAKRDLNAGEALDIIGGSTFYSLIDTYETARQEDLLPIGLAKGAKMKRSVAKDQPITYADVELDASSILPRLRKLQDEWMEGSIREQELAKRIKALAAS